MKAWLGITLMLGIDSAPFQALVRVAGSALRIAAPAFLGILEQSPALRRELNRYLYVSMSQLGQTAACIHFHVVEARHKPRPWGPMPIAGKWKPCSPP